MDLFQFMAALGMAGSIGIVLGLLGGGGTMLAVPLLMYVAGLAPGAAVGTALAIVALAGFSAALLHAQKGNVDWPTALIFAPAGMAGAFAGGWSAHFVPDSILTVLLCTGMLVAAASMWRAPPEPARSTRQVRRGMIIVAGALVGAATGLTGLGGGFLIVPALTLATRLPLRRAVGTSLVLVAANAIAGLAGHSGHLNVTLDTGAALGVGSILGALFGARTAFRVNVSRTRRAFAVLLSAAAIMTLQGMGWGWPAPAAAALLMAALALGNALRRRNPESELRAGPSSSQTDTLAGFVLDYQI